MDLKLITNINGDYDSVARMIMQYMNNESGIKDIFAFKSSRLASADIASIIEVDGNYVGFANLITECTRNMLFVDIGILEKYRGRGYCKAVLEYIRELGFSEYIISEILDTNVAANKCANDTGCLVYQFHGRNFYLLQSDLKDQFLESSDFEILKSHCIDYGNKGKKKKMFRDCY